MLQGKTIVLGVTGGIAAYKAAPLVSRLTQAGADVHVIMTESAMQFVQPLTFQTLSRNPVAVDTFDERDPAVVQHIDLADKADLMVIAPATANIIGKMACGIADDMLSTTYLATTAPVLVAPAMNVHMYAHPAVQANMRTLQERGVQLIEPGEGPLACGYTGKGRMAEPEQLFERIADMLDALASPGPLAGKRVLVTAGGTIERIDPVRYITNDSSGKMGFAFAEAAKAMGADVTIIHGGISAEPPAGVTLIRADSALSMLEAVLSHFDRMDLVVKAAAVADYRPAHPAERKIKKKGQTMTLELVKNPDIAETIGARKTKQFIIAFAAETDNIAEHAMNKLIRKNCDLVVANDVTEPGAGFVVDTNKVSVFDKNGLVEAMSLMSKRQTAERVLRIAAERMTAAGGAAGE